MLLLLLVGIDPRTTEHLLHLLPRLERYEWLVLAFQSERSDLWFLRALAIIFLFLFVLRPDSEYRPGTSTMKDQISGLLSTDYRDVQRRNIEMSSSHDECVHNRTIVPQNSQLLISV